MSDKKVDFEDCLDVLLTPPKEAVASDLSDFLGGDDDALPTTDDSKEHWKGMPEFVQETKKPFKKINVCFQTKEDFEEFRKLMDQPMTEKTKTIWFPLFDREKNSLFSWVENDSE